MKIKCKFTDKTFDINLGMRTIIKCPLCETFIEFSHGFIGLGFDVGIEIERNGFHEIIYDKNRI